MSSDFNEPAYPQFRPDPWNKPRVTGGLTIRQQAALMIAAGYAANPACEGDHRIAEWAVDLADATLRREAETRGRSDE